MNLEAEFHKRIKGMLSKSKQGYVMGAFREVIGLLDHNRLYLAKAVERLDLEGQQAASIEDMAVYQGIADRYAQDVSKNPGPITMEEELNVDWGTSIPGDDNYRPALGQCTSEQEAAYRVALGLNATFGTQPFSQTFVSMEEEAAEFTEQAWQSLSHRPLYFVGDSPQSPSNVIILESCTPEQEARYRTYHGLAHAVSLRMKGLACGFDLYDETD